MTLNAWLHLQHLTVNISLTGRQLRRFHMQTTVSYQPQYGTLRKSKDAERRAVSLWQLRLCNVIPAMCDGAVDIIYAFTCSQYQHCRTAISCDRLWELLPRSLSPAMILAGCSRTVEADLRTTSEQPGTSRGWSYIAARMWVWLRMPAYESDDRWELSNATYRSTTAETGLPVR